MYTVVVSDTHGNISGIIALLSARKDIERVLHLGDVARDVDDLETLFPSLKFEAVKGNNDFFVRMRDELLTAIGPKKAFMTHGHLYGVKSTVSNLVKRAKELGADTVLFGHTHRKCESVADGITLLNPSSSQYILFDNNGNYKFFDL